MYRVGILTVSDRGSRGERPVDLSGEAIRELVTGALAAEIAAYTQVPDEVDAIQETLLAWCDEQALDLVLTTGGTGFAPRDVTPEATAAIVERPTPGLSEAIRAASLAITPFAMLSRATSGIRGQTLIVNLPGSPKGVREALAVILPVLPHGLALLRDRPTEHARSDPPTP
jgi:molybdenum cofactor synthesis domain-containing protein